MKLLVRELVRRVEEMRPRVKWGDELENALKNGMGSARRKTMSMYR